MFKYWKTLAVVVVIATGAAAYVFYKAGGLAWLNPTVSTAPAFPVPPHEVFELRDESTGEIYRKKTMGGKDGTVVVKLEIAYTDDVLAWHTFSDEGKLQKVEEVYTKGGERKPRSLKLYAPDGERVIYADLWRLDGSVSIVVRQRADGTIVDTRYYENGKDVRDVRVYAKEGPLMSRRQFLPSGGLSAVYARLDDGSQEESTYFEDGKTIKRHQVVRGGETVLEELFAASGKPVWRKIVEPDATRTETFHASGKLAASRVANGGTYSYNTVTEFYREDGKTLRLKHTSTFSKDSAEYFNEAGKLTQERVFLGSGDMEVTVFDVATGKVAFRQRWDYSRNWSDPWGEGKLTLAQVSTYWQGNDEKLHLTLARDGKTILEAREYYSDGTMRKALRVYRGDGSVVSHEKYNDKGYLVERRLYRDNGSLELLQTFDGSRQEVCLTRKSSRADSTIEKVELFNAKGELETVRLCDKTGKCEKIETWKDGKVSKTDDGDGKVEAAEPVGVSEVVPAELLQQLQFEDPRNFKMDRPQS